VTAISDKELEENQWDSDLAWMMGDERGRRVMWELLAQTRAFQSSFSTNGSVTVFNEGRRHVGLWLMSELQTEEHRAAFLLMWNESITPETVKPNAPADT